MKTLKASVLILGLVVMFTACDSGEGGNGNNGNDSLKTVAIDTTPVDVRTECMSLKKNEFCWTGLEYMGLGDSILSLSEVAEGVIIKDTMLSQTDITEAGEVETKWFAKVARYEKGAVIIESDFRNPDLAGSIRIETPMVRHTSGMGLGTTVEELKTRFREELFVQPFQEYGVMEIIRIIENTRMIFHVPIDGIMKEGVAEYTINDIPNDKKVTRIVIM